MLRGAQLTGFIPVVADGFRAFNPFALPPSPFVDTTAIKVTV
jgi:hypothetical protein